MGRDARNIDDAPFFSRNHPRTKGLTRQKCAADKIEIEIKMPVLEINRLEGSLRRHGNFWIVAACGIHEHRGSAELVLNLIPGVLETLQINGIGRKKLRATTAAANGLHALEPSLGMPSDDGHGSPRIRQPVCHRSAEHARGTDHNRNFVLEIKLVHKNGKRSWPYPPTIAIRWFWTVERSTCCLPHLCVNSTFMRIDAWVLLACLFLVGCESTPKKSESPTIYRGMTIDIQPGPKAIVASEPGDGFAVHYVRLNEADKAMIGIYEGQRPKLFSKKERDLTMMRRGNTSRGGIERGDDAWGVDGTGNIWRESVWTGARPMKTKEGKTFTIPIMIHIWYFGASDEQAAAFDQIIATIDVTH